MEWRRMKRNKDGMKELQMDWEHGIGIRMEWGQGWSFFLVHKSAAPLQVAYHYPHALTSVCPGDELQ